MIDFDECKNCTNRHVGCHSTCKHYIIGKIIDERARQRRKKESQYYGYRTALFAKVAHDKHVGSYHGRKMKRGD